ncbi:MAG: L,D-transpeptidase family protein [Planctomycetes bacterium]|nr:L,D-transpeptidase family protein [Planctomycetota bacterium]
MRHFLAFVALTVFFSGCTLTGSQGGDAVRNEEPAPAKAVVEQPTTTPADDGHFGDPTFEKEVVSAEPETPAITAPARDTDLTQGLDLKAKGELRAARMSLTLALSRKLPAADEADALSALDEINGKIFLSTGDDGDMQIYEVKSGDTLGAIGAKFKTTAEFIKRLNEMKKDTIFVGQRLHLPKGEFSLVVRKERFVMDLKLDGALIKRYRVGLGLNNSTPVGEFVVKNRIPEPADGSWPYGHEKHRLGSRWLGLKSDAGHRGYGIHGCPASENGAIGGECSQGCVRLTNEDVEEIYDIIPIGAKLTVVSDKSLVEKPTRR